MGGELSHSISIVEYPAYEKIRYTSDMKPAHKDWRYFVKVICIIIGLVLVWRGIWHLLDIVDDVVFAGERIWTALGGVILGFIVLYLPDHDLKEIEKL